ncbi:MAG: aconitate hydratase AcnA [Candidatus Accumulibacter sp.]|uniref:aconitate hydratase AcnA n=1 Tax=Accumulibacter sp. TaxID=2053492 RepID=UPI00287AF2E3|nr:aconitate hydratase AcnA [Accumulibacter sp.]MDS4015544.1 aconitate hydratase AcnA [Accumulibacter sp.]
MSESLDPFSALRSFSFGAVQSGKFYALKAIGSERLPRLPVSLRIVLESLLRHCDGRRVSEAQVRALANWQPNAVRSEEIPFVVARVVLQDFTGVPLLCDLAAMREAAARAGADPRRVEPRVPVDLVVDHSVQVDHQASADALDLNMRLEFKRNAERYRFIKWGMQAFDTFRVVPPGVGIVHQVNLEWLARGLRQADGVFFPDTLVGTDSHTTMINALGVVGWGVGGIEAEAAMLGQPVAFLTPDVVGVHLSGRLAEGVTATDLVLAVTERLRRARVVGKFVEFFGEGAATLSLPDRATIANMAPEYGATMGFFPVDAVTVDYLAATGRSAEEVAAFAAYFEAQGLFGMPKAGEIDYSEDIVIDLTAIRPAVAGPRRPQDRIELPALRERFIELFSAPAATGGYERSAEELSRRHALALSSGTVADIGDGDVLIAAITSCTNTSNPGVMLAAGLLAQKAVARGLSVKPRVKTSLAPGSRVVTDYLAAAGLLQPLEKLGFHVVAYGCTTCIGNAGPLDAAIETTLAEHDLVCAAVLSGNRNFEARIHPAIKANFLASPPLVVAFAIAGRVDVDLASEPLGRGLQGEPVYLRDIWPSPAEVAALLHHAQAPGAYLRRYRDLSDAQPLWRDIPAPQGVRYAWDASTYIAEPPFLADARPLAGDIVGARILAVFGDSVTTDHISPAGNIKTGSPAGLYLQERGVAVADFNSYGARRGHHEVMLRGTFANVRIRNLMLPPKADGTRIEGGFTCHQPSGEVLPIFEAAMRYRAEGVPTVIFAGEEYGTGSSRDWAAKGTALLGVRAVIAKSFERIHRANLVGMGVLPIQLPADCGELRLAGDEIVGVVGIEKGVRPQQAVTLVIRAAVGGERRIEARLRVDTPVEVEYLRAGGILPYVLKQLTA